MTCRIVHVITRLVRGGAARVAVDLSVAARGWYGACEVMHGAEEPPDPALARELAAAGVATRVVLELVRDPSPVRDLAALSALTRSFRENPPDLVHAHTSKAGVLAVLAASRAGVRAIVFAPHGNVFPEAGGVPGVPPAGLRRRAMMLGMRLAGSRAHRVIALSEADRTRMNELRLAPADRIVVISNGLRLPPLDAVISPVTPRSGGAVIGVIARMTAEKGHSVLLRAAAQLRGVFPGLTVRLVGGGPLKASLRAEAAGLGIGNAVEFLGFRDVLPPLLAKMDVVAVPSTYEGFGLTIVEAMGMARPVVASRVGGIPEVVAEGETGLLVPPGDHGALAEAMAEILKDPAQARAMGEAGRRRAERLFSLEIMLERYRNLYDELLEG